MAVVKLLHEDSGDAEQSSTPPRRESSSSSAVAAAGALLLPLAPSTSLATRLTACLQYGLVSICITLFNRAVFSVYQFNFPSTVTLLQVVVSLVYMYALRAVGRMRFGSLHLATARKVGVCV